MLKQRLGYLITWVVCCYLVNFLLTRGIIIGREYGRISASIEHDRFFCTHTCAAEGAAQKLGERASECYKACAYDSRWPFWEAVLIAAKQTHLCGDQRCIEIAVELTGTWRAVAAWIFLSVFAPFMLAELFKTIKSALSIRWSEYKHNKRFNGTGEYTPPPSVSVDFSNGDIIMHDKKKQ